MLVLPMFVLKLSVQEQQLYPYYYRNTSISHPSAMKKRPATPNTVCKRPAKKAGKLKMENDAADCKHPTDMQSAAGSNKYRARMTCLACGQVLYNLDRQQQLGWEQFSHGLSEASALRTG